MFHPQCKIGAHKDEEKRCLPEDMIEEILLRLTVKSLLKFRCVSKSWLDLIDSKRFMKTHLQNSIKSKSVAHYRIILKTTKGLQQYSLPSLLNDLSADSISCNEINVDVGVIRLVGCCNGLVCILVNRTRFILWNPATKKSRNLPDFDNKMEDKMINKYGFGFDELSNDYKVFGLALVSNARVYSLKTNSWKVVEERDDRLVRPSYEAGVYASGKLHWYVHDDDYKREIVSFDLNSHAYGVVELPSDYSKVESSFYRLGAHSGHLITVGVHEITRDIDIWTMKEYRAKESWVKSATIPSLLRYYGCSSVCMGPYLGVLITHRIAFKVFYSPKCNLLRYPEIIPCAPFDKDESGIYVESLASLDPEANMDVV